MFHDSVNNKQLNFLLNSFSIRLFKSSDSIAELTSLLNRAYKPLADRGMNFVASHQTEEQTSRHPVMGECFIAVSDRAVSDGSVIAGTIFIYSKKIPLNGPELYNDPDVLLWGKFAVEPSLQKTGIGKKLMNFIENLAVERGKKYLALDTSERAQDLIDYYTRNGYKFVCYHKWDVVNYRSVVMKKELINTV